LPLSSAAVTGRSCHCIPKQARAQRHSRRNKCEEKAGRETSARGECRISQKQFVAHPALDAAQKKAIERDYGMENGVLVLNSRLALAYYVIRCLNLDLTEEQISPVRQQIFLTNAAEVKEIERAAEAEGTRRVRIAAEKSRKG
jgi:hypothetical protein